jgi:environmental stress-induced protein Ves
MEVGRKPGAEHSIAAGADAATARGVRGSRRARLAVMSRAPELITPDQYRTTPWRTGGGVTHEILAGPDGASLERGFDWRLSIAEVASPGPFSAFPDCTRTLTLLDGALTLAFGARRVALAPRVPFEFDGGLACTGELPRGPARDLNAITRRGAAAHSVSIVPAGADARRQSAAALLAVLALDAETEVRRGATRMSLPPGATLVLRGGGEFSLASAGAVALVAITPRRP